jgi:dihydrofolate reductase
MATIKLICAMNAAGVIGINHQLPWHLPEDLKHFKQHTVGQTVVMGRQTWDSLPKQWRPLPQRHNIVLTRQDYADAETRFAGASVANTWADAVAQTATATLFVIGGGQIYQQTLPLADELVITRVAVDVTGDTYFPKIDPTQWQCVEQFAPAVSQSGIAYQFERWCRK